MRHLLLFLFMFPILAQAKQCWLTTEVTQDSHYYVDCRKGPSPYKRLCRVDEKAEGSKLGQVYEVKIVKTPDGIIENIQEWFDLNSRDWTPDAVLEEGEFIRCQVDKTKLQAEKDKRAQEREARRLERLAETDRLDKLDRAKRQYCQKQNKQALEKILCAEWKREALEE